MFPFITLYSTGFVVLSLLIKSVSFNIIKRFLFWYRDFLYRWITSDVKYFFFCTFHHLDFLHFYILIKINLDVFIVYDFLYTLCNIYFFFFFRCVFLWALVGGAEILKITRKLFCGVRWWGRGTKRAQSLFVLGAHWCERQCDCFFFFIFYLFINFLGWSCYQDRNRG